MTRAKLRAVTGTSDEAYQEQILPHVSRTFALTIPQLPAGLRSAVTSAYLLCRIADTIEDEPAVSPAQAYVYLQRFAAVVCGREDARALAREVEGCLTERTLPAERDLMHNMERVVRLTQRLSREQRAAIQHCVELMCAGMHDFQQSASVSGLARSSDLDSYCYYVAGVVGEMLTELFCAYSAEIARHREALFELAASFGQGLQMTNILKDMWEDRSRGACWLPQDVFTRHGIELAQLTPGRSEQSFGAGLRELIAVAHGHLRNAMTFTLLIPREEGGIRRFCLWAVGLAVLTLRRIAGNPQFTAGAQVKVSHSAVALTRLLTSLAVRHDRTLLQLFDWAAGDLPLAAPAEVCLRSRAATVAAHQPAAHGGYAGSVLRGQLSATPLRTDGSAAQ
ncbi:MAG TPA: phytoene/squalene synthase family protein [Steroidobacteraceae bacterium]|nr:phytoene/squalene synthase family protein [Steroidobacteraceae bacterium]